MQTVSLIYLEQVILVPVKISKWIPIPFQISTLLGLQYWSFYSNKYGRISALFMGGKIWIIACVLVMIMPPISKGVTFNNLLFYGDIEGIKMLILILIIILVGFGASTAYLIPWSLLPDAIDQDPEKPSGVYTAWMVFIQKIGIGLSVQFLGVLLSLSGYKSSTNCLSSLEDLDQPLTAIITIRLCMGLIPSFLVIAGLITMKPFRNLDLKSGILSQ
jgi:GPH family glycoside/pentoside/hexuronide:cation symporter